MSLPNAAPASSSPRILVVDDEKNLVLMLAKILRRNGMDIVTASDGQEALSLVEATIPDAERPEQPPTQAAFDCVITDLQMPIMDGMSLLKTLREKRPEIPVIVLTGHGSIQSAVDAMKAGAVDYLIKPCNPDEIILVIQRTLNVSRLERENRAMKQQLVRYEPAHEIVGESRGILEVLRIVESVARNRSNVLIYGESGTGKELVARAIHDSGPWARYPFVAVNCGALSETLLESQLFGHRRGAFTGAVADHIGFFQAAENGTLFLDEISEMSPHLQVKLLRAIQQHEIIPVGDTQAIKVNVRLICATNRDLEYEVRNATFRQDLFYRLNVVNLRLPALRERAEDVPMLVNHFILMYAKEYDVAPKVVQAEAMNALMQYPWPGNIRELQNVIERTFALSTSDAIGLEDLPQALFRSPEEAMAAVRAARPMPTAQSIAWNEAVRSQPGWREQAPPPTPQAPPMDVAAAAAAPQAWSPAPPVLPNPAAPATAYSKPFVPVVPPGPLTLDEMERKQITEALRRAKGKKVEAARILGIDRKRLYRKMKKYELA